MNLRTITASLDNIASLFQENHESLGISEKVAMDFAQRCDLLSDALEKTASQELKIVKDVGLKKQLQLLLSNPPRTQPQESVDGATLHVVQVFSPVVKKYIPMSEHPQVESAKSELAFWEKDHARLLKNFREAISDESKSDKTAVRCDLKTAAGAMANVWAVIDPQPNDGPHLQDIDLIVDLENTVRLIHHGKNIQFWPNERDAKKDAEARIKARDGKKTAY